MEQTIQQSPIMAASMSQQERMDLAVAIALYWESVCARLDIEPNKIKIQLPAGSSPLKHSVKLVEYLCNKNMSEDKIYNALIKCDQISTAHKYFMTQRNINYSNDGGSHWYVSLLPSMNKIADSAVIFPRLCDALGMTQYYESLRYDQFGRVTNLLKMWESVNGQRATKELFCQQVRKYQLNSLAELVEAMPDTIIHNADCGVSVGNAGNATTTPYSQRAESSDFDNPFKMVKTVETFRTFVRRADAFYTNICLIMNTKGLWTTLLKNYGVLSNPAAAKLVTDLNAEWTSTRSNNPANKVFMLLSDADFGDKSLDDLIDDLRKIDSAELHAVIDDLVAFRNKTKTAQVEKNQSVYCANVDLRNFLIKHKIAKPENVDACLAKLTHSNVGVSEPEHLAMMSYADFIAAGFSIIESKMLEKSVASMSST